MTLTTELANTNAGDYISPNLNVYYNPPYPVTWWPTVQYVYPPVANQRCAWCQGYHWDKCPRLKSVKYRDDGTVEHVEFFPA